MNSNSNSNKKSKAKASEHATTPVPPLSLDIPSHLSDSSPPLPVGECTRNHTLKGTNAKLGATNTNERLPLSLDVPSQLLDDNPPVPIDAHSSGHVNKFTNDKLGVPDTKKTSGRPNRRTADRSAVSHNTVVANTAVNGGTSNDLRPRDTANTLAPSTTTEQVGDSEQIIEIPEAFLVEENQQADIPFVNAEILHVDENADENTNAISFNRSYVCGFLVIVAILVISAVAALGAVLSRKRLNVTNGGIEANGNNSLDVTNEGNTAPESDIMQTLSLVDVIEEHVLQRNAKFSTMEKDNPRWLALDWILHKDKMQLGKSDVNLSQRYVLAMLAFQFDYLAWKYGGGNYSDPGISIVENESTKDNAQGHIRWLTSTPECGWYGVTCVNGNVHRLELAENNLIGQIPPEIKVLEYLGVLTMNSNCLVGTLPSEMGSLTKLQLLNLEDNGLSGHVPDELFDMSSLTHLNLAWQSNWRNCTSSSGELVDLALSSSGESNWGLEGAFLQKNVTALRHLKEIIISGNYFSGEITPDIKNLKQLEILSAGNNAFSGSLPDEISELGNLREIGFEFNWLTGSIPQDIGQASALESISFFGIQNMTGTLPDSFYNLTNVKYLWLYENQFEGSIKTEIGNLRELIHLGIYNNKFTGTLPSELGNCKKLEWIQIQGNEIVGTVPKEVCDLRIIDVWNSEDPYVEVLKADCSPDSGSELNEAFIQCDCCNTCCDHTTNLCVNLQV